MKWTKEVLDVLADKLLEWMKVDKNLWLGDFAIENKMYRTQLDELSDTKRSEMFSHALKIAKTMQESKLFKFGLSKNCNPAMAIFALKNVAQWRDKTDVTSNDQTVTAVEITIKKNRER